MFKYQNKIRDQNRIMSNLMTPPTWKLLCTTIMFKQQTKDSMLPLPNLAGLANQEYKFY